MFNLFRLPENEIFKVFSIQERRKNRHDFGRTKVCKAEEVRKFFVDPKMQSKLSAALFAVSISKLPDDDDDDDDDDDEELFLWYG